MHALFLALVFVTSLSLAADNAPPATPTPPPVPPAPVDKTFPVDATVASFLTLGVPVAWAVELAPRVPLFNEIWEQDPDAIFAGDALRDYLAELRFRAAQ